jgi:hypothetical protein
MLTLIIMRPDIMSEFDFEVATGKLAARLFGAGSIGLLFTCIFYVLAGPLAALPGGATSTAAAIAATRSAAGWMRAAGLFGMPSDVLLAVGAFLFAAHGCHRKTELALAGWITFGIAAALFIVVDAMVSMVLPVAASSDSSYAGTRALFDVLFTIGSWTAGAGALAVAWRRTDALFRWPVVGWGMRTAGAICFAAATAHLSGWPGARLIGPGIALLALAGIGVAMSCLLYRVDPERPAD